METNSADNLARLYGELFVLLQQEEKLRQETERKLEKAKAVIDPRKQFNNWLKTNSVQTWKFKKPELQGSMCAACQTKRIEVLMGRLQELEEQEQTLKEETASIIMKARKVATQ